jgi:hypothetical protein
MRSSLWDFPGTAGPLLKSWGAEVPMFSGSTPWTQLLASHFKILTSYFTVLSNRTFSRPHDGEWVSSHTLTWDLFSSGHKVGEPLENGSGTTAAGEGDRGGNSETVSEATDRRSNKLGSRVQGTSVRGSCQRVVKIVRGCVWHRGCSGSCLGLSLINTENRTYLT